MSAAAREAFNDWQRELLLDPDYQQWLDDLDRKSRGENEMSFISKNSGEDFKLVPEGTHLARCYLMVDVGYQETNFGTKLQVVLGFEIPGELMDDGRPMIIYKTFTNSMHEKATLRISIESWRGKKLTETEARAFDLRNVLGHPCQLSIVHRDVGGRTYANIAAITGLPKGLPVPEQVNPSICFDIDAGDDPSILPNWLQTKVAEAGSGDAGETTQGLADQAAADENFDDDIPF